MTFKDIKRIIAVLVMYFVFKSEIMDSPDIPLWLSTTACILFLPASVELAKWYLESQEKQRSDKRRMDN